MKISQREARRMRKQLDVLKRQIAGQRSTYNQQYRGTEIARYTDTVGLLSAATRVARALGHSVVVVGDESSVLRFMALPHPSEPIL